MTMVDGGGIAMHKTMIGAAAGLALLHCITNLGCERDYFSDSRNAPRFAYSDRGLLVRMVGGLNGSTQRRSILPMLL